VPTTTAVTTTVAAATPTSTTTTTAWTAPPTTDNQPRILQATPVQSVAAAGSTIGPFVLVGDATAGQRPVTGDSPTRRWQVVTFDAETIADVFVPGGSDTRPTSNRDTRAIIPSNVSWQPFRDVRLNFDGTEASAFLPAGLANNGSRPIVSWSGNHLDSAGNILGVATMVFVPRIDGGYDASGNVWDGAKQYHLQPTGPGQGVWLELDPNNNETAEGYAPASSGTICHWPLRSQTIWIWRQSVDW
jgi:hypothetical protein